MNKVTKYIYNVSKFFAVLMVGVVIWYSATAGDYSKFLIYDTSIALNDSIVSAWTPLNGSTNVSVFFSAGDTTWARLELEYRYGAEVGIINLADTMTLDTRYTTLAGKSVGKIYQGFGLATSLIPGANAIRLRAIMKSATSASSYLKAGLVYGD